MTRCKYCGGPVGWKDNRGWYRDFCCICSKRFAAGYDLRVRFDPNGEPDYQGVIVAGRLNVKRKSDCAMGAGVLDYLRGEY